MGPARRVRRFVTTAILFSLLTTITSHADSDARVAVKIRVRNSAGEAIRGAYVALVPAWRTTSHPLAEDVTENDVATLRVPADDYRLIAGAPGHAVWSRQPITVTADGAADVSIALPDLRRVSGTVTDEQGRPIAGARIRTVHGATAPGLGTLSELAVRQLQSDWSTTTGADGRWTLTIPAGPTPVLVQAARRAEEWRVVQETDADAVAIVLSQGSTLRVTSNRLDPDLVLTLARDDATAGTTVPADVQPRVWAQWANAKTLVWDSLKPGTYSVYAKYPKPAFFMQTAVKLATVELQAREEKQIDVELPAKRAAAEHTSRLFISRWNRADLGPVSAFGSTRDGGARPVDAFVEEVIHGWVVHFRADDARTPFVVVAADEVYTSPRVPKRKSDDEPPLAVQHPRADAYAHLRLADDEGAAPRSGSAALRDCADESSVFVPVEVKADGLARFTAPANCRTLVLTFAPYEAIVIERRLQAGDQSLGEFTLRRGGSAEVRVVRGSDESGVAGATVRVATAVEDGGSSTLIGEASTNDDGWVRLAGLPAQRDLRITAETTDGDRADGVVVRIEPGEQRVLEPLVVVEPATVIVDAKIDPVVLQRFPDTRVTVVQISPMDPARRGEMRQLNTPIPAAPVSFERVHRGQWLVEGWVTVAGVPALVPMKTLELEPGKTYRIEDPVTPNVFEGVVKDEGKGIAARVLVEENGRRPHFDSDERGVFRAVLQEKGPHMVAVARMSDQGNVMPVGEIDFTDPSRLIEIAIPATAAVTARVRSNGKAVTSAVVLIRRRTATGAFDEITSRGRTTDQEGSARFEDVTPGEWTLSVRQPDGRRADKAIRVTAEKNVSVDLDISDAARIEGTVRDASRAPLARAYVDCLFVGSTGAPDRASTDSAVDGTFSIELPVPAPKNALCSVMSASGAVDAFVAAPGTSVDATISHATGTLRVERWDERKGRDLLWLISPDGRAVHLQSIAIRLGQFGPILVIPALAAGEWNVVRVRSMSDLLTIANRAGSALPVLTTVRAAPGEPRTLDVNEVW